MQKNRYVLDTNIWISAIISNSLEELELFIKNKNLKIYICPEMILEFEDVLKRAKFKKYLKESVSHYISKIQKISTLKASETKYNEAPDEDDNYCMIFALTQKAF